jgi:predicted permease
VEAERRARVELGPAARHVEETRDAWRIGWAEDLWADLRYGARALRREPGFLASAVLSLALGIGVNTAIFSLTMELLASRPSAREPETLVLARLGGASHMPLADLQALRERGAFPDIAGLREEAAVNWRNGEVTERLFAIRVTDNLFQMAGIPLAMGRGIGAGDEDGVVVTHRFWQGKLNGDAGVVGRTLVLDGRVHRVVGVLPEDHRTLFGFGLSPDLYTMARDPRGMVGLYIRLGERMSPLAVRERLRVVVEEWEKTLPVREYPYAQNIKVQTLAGMHRLTEAKGVSVFFGMLMGVVSLLLGIACLNVSGLLLARASARVQEFSIRASLGAGRGRLIRQLLAESLLLAVGGTAAGLLLHEWITTGLRRVELPLPVPIVLQLEPDWRLFAYASLVAAVCTVAAGLLPALRMSRAGMSEGLKQREHQVGGKLNLRRGLVVAQVAASIVVLVTAALFARNLTESAEMDPGFDLEQTLYVSVRVVPERYADAAAKGALVERMAGAIGAMPGVEMAAATAVVPLNDDITNGGMLHSDVRPEPKRISRHANRVGPGYFATMGVPVVAGREFGGREARGVILNETLARELFGSAPAVGHTVSGGKWEAEVVGVVRDSKYAWFGDRERPAMFHPYEMERETLHFMVRAGVDPETLVRPLQRVVTDLDASMAVEVKPMRRATAMALLPSRVGAGLLGAMGVLGLLLTGIGLYGLLAYTVARRVREIGLRVALGATPRKILRLVFGEGAWLVGIGVGVGVLVAVFVTRPLALFLVPGLSTTDPVSYVGVVLVLAVTGWAACAAPARRALRIAPMEALREE